MNPKRKEIPRLPVLFVRGLFKRCPRCGAGHVFASYTRLRTSCPKCRLLFERAHGAFADAWLGSITINMAFTWMIILVSLLVGFVVTWPHTPALALTVAVMAVTGAFSILFVPNSKTLWVAIELWLRGFDPEDLADVEKP